MSTGRESADEGLSDELNEIASVLTDGKLLSHAAAAQSSAPSAAAALRSGLPTTTSSRLISTCPSRAPGGLRMSPVLGLRTRVTSACGVTMWRRGWARQ